MAAILEEMSRKRQTLLFSATQTKRVADLASLSLSEPQYISVHADSKTATPTRLQHHHMLIEPEQKLDVLWGFVRSHLQAKTICFLSSCKQAAAGRPLQTAARARLNRGSAQAPSRTGGLRACRFLRAAPGRLAALPARPAKADEAAGRLH